MICQDFLARYSEFVDGELDPRRAARMQEHLVDCAACARYDRVVRQGTEIARGLPEVEPSYDFFPRLQHRIYNLEEDLRSRRDASTTGAAVSLAVAGALALLAWAPLLRSALDPVPSPDGVPGTAAVEESFGAEEPVQLAAEGATAAQRADAGQASGRIDGHAPSALSWHGYAAEPSWRPLPEPTVWRTGRGGIPNGDLRGDGADEWSRRAASWLIGAERPVEPRWWDAPARSSTWAGRERVGQGWSIGGQGQAVAGWYVAGGARTALDPRVSTMYRVRILDVPANGVGDTTQRRIDSSLNPE